MRKKVVLLTWLTILISFAHSFGHALLQSGYSAHRGLSHVRRSPEESGWSGTRLDEWPIMLPYSDEFDMPDLDPKWQFDNPGPNPDGQLWSLVSSPGFLSMTTTGPTDLIGDINTAPKMLENSPDGDFRIVVRVLAAPDVLFEHAGILVMQSPTNWVRLIRDSNCYSVYLQASGGNWQCSPFSGSDVILRLTKSGSIYEGAYSSDGGASYTVIGYIQGPGVPAYIGTTVVSTPLDNVFSAEFDYFRVFWTPPPPPELIDVLQDTLTLVDCAVAQAFVSFTICNPDYSVSATLYSYNIRSVGTSRIPVIDQSGTVVVNGGECKDVYGIIDASLALPCDYDTLTIIVWTPISAVYDTCVQVIHIIESLPVPLFTAPVVTILMLTLIITAAAFIRRRVMSSGNR